jgi:NOL1/NOP2/sun family putative RNA methylase
MSEQSRPLIPQAFLARMERWLGDEYPAFLASYDQPAPNGLRANTLKIAPEALRERLPFALESLAWPPAAFRVSEEEQPGRHPYHAAGLYYLQDPSAMSVAALLAPQPGERVLDLAAAPGGKATHLASLLANQGLLVANEIHPRRVWDLAENLERWGARNAAITAETPERLAERFPDFFDRVLLDAPCSGEGMFRKSDAARREWAAELVLGCASRQTGILDAAARMLRPGGLLAYSTCTFAAEEDEGTVARFLETNANFEAVEPAEPARQAGFAPGRPEWLGNEKVGEAVRAGLRRTVRLWPHTGPGEGHFIALLRRREREAHEDVPGWRLPKLPVEAIRFYETFCREHLQRAPATERLALAGSYLYQVPAGLPDLSGLRFIHPGWWLGTLKKGRFEPSQGLAMGLNPADVRQVANLDAAAPQLLTYLRGESLPSTGADGWVLVTVDGFPLGWGKRVQGTLKSHYPRGLRRV